MFHIDIDLIQMKYEIYEDGKLIHRQVMEAPVFVHKQQYVDLLNQMSRDPKPMSFRISMKDMIWDEIEQKQKCLENYIEFKNNAFLTKYGRDEEPVHEQ